MFCKCNQVCESMLNRKINLTEIVARYKMSLNYIDAHNTVLNYVL